MKMLAIVLALGLAGCAQHASTPKAAESKSTTDMTQKAPAVSASSLEVAKFRQLIDQHPEYVLLDVRTPEEYATGHLPGARLVDFKAPDFDQKIAALDASKTYLLYCRTGHRSGLAREKMAAENFNAYDLAGGITAWKAADLPMTQQ